MMPAHRCGRSWVRRSIRQIYGSQFHRRALCVWYLVPISASEVSNLTRTDCSSVGTLRCSCASEDHQGRLYPLTAFRQHGLLPYHLQHGLSKSGAEAGTLFATPSARKDEGNDPYFMAAVGTQQVCGQSESILEPSRSSSNATITRVRGIVAAVTNHASVLALRGHTHGRAPIHRSAICREVGRRTEPSLAPSTTFITATLLKIKEEKARSIIVHAIGWERPVSQCCNSVS